MPAVAIVLFTYNRPDYAKATLLSLAKHLRYPGPLDLHIADDGSPDQRQIHDLLKMAKGGFRRVTSSNSQRHGYGASYNLATQTTHLEHDYILAVEDDWTLKEDLDLLPLVLDLSRERPWMRCIRLGYIGFTQELRATFRVGDDRTYLAFDPHSPEPHVFAGHPRLETTFFEKLVGPWPEDTGAGATEFEVAHRWEARNGVVWPFFLGPSVFGHIGTIRAEESK
jgi:glycosyltransferase involved in cell wall biosynthesis